MPSFEIGKMFWGKSLSYPWWPCLIIPNEKNEISRNRKKLGIQYHVQFLGSDYDVCWITDSFLIEYDGKESFESFVEAQLSSDLSPQEKIKFDMRMSSNTQLLWVQACHDADRIFPMDAKLRLTELPQPSVTSIIIPTSTKIVSKRNLSRLSVTDSNPDQLIENNERHFKTSRNKRKIDNTSSYKELDEDESDSDVNDKDVSSKKYKPRKKISKTLSKESNCDENSDKDDVKEVVIESIKKRRPVKKRYSYVTDNEDDEMESGSIKSSIKSDKIILKDEKALDKDIEERCFKSYMAKEMLHRLSDMNLPVIKKTQENMLRKQWDALDMPLKLQYLNDEVSLLGESKSKVSGRKIRIPSKLRRTEDFGNLKKLTPKMRSSEPLNRKIRVKPETTVVPLSVKTEMAESVTNGESSLSSNAAMRDSAYRETINENLWNSLTVQDCASEMMRIVVMKSLPEVRNICCHCFKTLSPSDKTVHCKGPCQSSFHLTCAIQNKIIRSEDVSLCAYCNNKYEVCCICNNSKYMKKQSLVKCLYEECHCYFHVSCVKFLIFIERNASDKDPELCPKHSCLTCSREEYNHSCNDSGGFVSCIKCPISYHSNLVCIPAGCRIIGKNKLVCYRHFDNSFVLKKAQQLTRCFICFNDKATLKCCRCRAVFHPKCMAMATYTDLLRDYVCNTCKLEQPMFQGQVVWVEFNKRWCAAEIVNSIDPVVDDVNERFAKSLTVRHLKTHQYGFFNRCELIPFEIGVSVLKEFIVLEDPVIKLAKLRNVSYWNWRCRLRPLTSEKYTLIGQSDLMEYSTNGYKSIPQTVAKYDPIDENVVPEHVQKLIPLTSESCTCKFPVTTCTDDRCSNYRSDIECCDSNCTNESCNNRIFAQIPLQNPTLILSVIANQGVKLNGNFDENRLLGELKGTLMSEEDVKKEIHKRELLESVSYVFHMLGNIFISSERQGNKWRYINHSCEPNSKVVCRNVSGSLKLGIVSLKPIADEEITIDYRESVVLKCGFVCHCQSPMCSQIIGPTSIFDNDNRYISPVCCSKNDSSKTSSPAMNFSPVLTVRRMNMTPVKPLPVGDGDTDNTVIDDRVATKVSCYKCGTHGEFIACDRRNCKKQYHMMCIEKSSRPTGLWLCPIHFCCYCNSAATFFCDNCPISCCKKHSKYHLLHTCTSNPICNTEEEIVDSRIYSDNPKRQKREEIVKDEKVPDITDKVRSIIEGIQYGEGNNGNETDDNLRDDSAAASQYIDKIMPEKSDQIIFSDIISEVIVETSVRATEDDICMEIPSREGAVVLQEAIVLSSLTEDDFANKSSTVANTAMESCEEESTVGYNEILDDTIMESVLTETLCQKEEIAVISKDDLYVACGLVPVATNGGESPPPILVNLNTWEVPLVPGSVDGNQSPPQIHVNLNNDDEYEVPIIVDGGKIPPVSMAYKVAKNFLVAAGRPYTTKILNDNKIHKVPIKLDNFDNSPNNLTNSDNGQRSQVQTTSHVGKVSQVLTNLDGCKSNPQTVATSDNGETSQGPIITCDDKISQVSVTLDNCHTSPQTLVTSDNGETCQVSTIVSDDQIPHIQVTLCGTDALVTVTDQAGSVTSDGNDVPVTLYDDVNTETCQVPRILNDKIPVAMDGLETSPLAHVSSDNGGRLQVPVMMTSIVSEEDDHRGDNDCSTYRLESDSEDIRCEIMPSKIDDMEDTIISPCILDD